MRTGGSRSVAGDEHALRRRGDVDEAKGSRRAPVVEHPPAAAGSGNLIRWLLDHELVDEITLLTYPVVIGQGARLFPDTGPDAALDLADSEPPPAG